MTLVKPKSYRWLTIVLLVVAAGCLPLVIGEARWFPEANRLLVPTFLAILVGIELARSPLPGWMAWATGLGLSIEVALQVAGGILPPVGLLLGDAGQALGWLWQVIMQRTVAAPWPFARSIEHLITHSQQFVTNLLNWQTAVQLAQPTEDITALLLGTVSVVWLLVWNASYELFRGRRTFVAMLPLGVGVVLNVAFTDYGMRYVQVYLGVTLLMLVAANVERMQEMWGRLALDFSDELRQDALRVGGIISVVIIALALMMPYVTYGRAVWAFWERFGNKFETFYDELDKAFAGRNPVPEPTPGGPGLAPHTLTTGATLGEDVVLLVEISDPPPMPEEELRLMGMDTDASVTKHYWRERTYDLYTSHGWDSSEGETADYAAGEQWKDADYPSTVLTQTYQIMGTTPAYAFAVNEPVLVDQEYRVLVRAEGDLAALSVGKPGYTVVSRIPEVTEEALDRAEAAYPDEVSELYLQLPRELPKRVRDLAEQVVAEAGASTRYDKARAIEQYIRNFEYDLAVEPPPLDADVVDYFLFSTQRGYCDYSATSMVVMLRAVGVAARYASGYAMGDYDFGRGLWVVRERSAHAWAEVYFPEWGWVEFEPTPIQRIFVRPRELAEGMSPEANLPQADQERAALPLWAYALILVAMVAFVVVWPPRYLRRRSLAPRESIMRVYERLLRRARWAGVGPHPGQTSAEYLIGLGRWMVAQTDWDTTRDMAIIARGYQRARYSQEDITNIEGHRVEDAWRRSRRYLTRLMFKSASAKGLGKADER
jgi:hypothetical protein